MVPNEEEYYKILIEDAETQVENEEALTMEVEKESHNMNCHLQDSDSLISEWDALALKEVAMMEMWGKIGHFRSMVRQINASQQINQVNKSLDFFLEKDGHSCNQNAASKIG